MHTFIKQLLSTATILLLLSVFNISYASSDHGHGEETEDLPENGLHGGKLFRNGDITLELAIFEQGMPPEYRAWITDHGAEIDMSATSLSVTLTRLDGQQDVFNFKAKDDYLLGNGVVTEPHSFDVAVRLQYKGNTHSWQFESHEGRVEIANEIAVKAGIKTQTAGPGAISQTTTVYGKTSTEHSKISHIGARFPGQIISVNTHIGDQVKAGDVLAIVESNKSLLRYAVKAPFAGLITERHANPGEVTQDQALFTLADYTQLWVELQVYPMQAQNIAIGQAVALDSGLQKIDSSIQHLVPNSMGKPYVVAGVPLDNSTGQWTPGIMFKGEVTTHHDEVSLAVDNRALQSFRDWTVVFIKVGEHYEIRPLKLGRSDGQFSEVLSGLNSGDEYVVENSYLIKADIEKSGASHDH